MAESKTPSSFVRAAFWTAYVLGTLILVFAFLLAQVPRGHNRDFTLDYICWSSSAVLMLTCILVARRIRKSGNSVTQRVAASCEADDSDDSIR